MKFAGIRLTDVVTFVSRGMDKSAARLDVPVHFGALDPRDSYLHPYQ